MMLIEQTSVPGAAMPVAEFRDHLRLGTGFSDDTLQDSLLESCLSSAMSAIEGRTGKALISRSYLLSLTFWRDSFRQILPVAPLESIDGIVVVDRAGTPSAVDPALYRLVPDAHRPMIEAVGGALPFVPQGGAIEVTLTAGFGPTWGDLPEDLQRAMLMLAANFYDHRYDGGSDGGLPLGVAALVEKYRVLRIGGGLRQ